MHLAKKHQDIRKTKDELAKIQYEKKCIVAEMALNRNAADPIKFITEKNKVMELRKSEKNWLRKIEIAELEAKKARAILKVRDRQTMSYQYQ
jgi:hypothetical protein